MFLKRPLFTGFNFSAVVCVKKKTPHTLLNKEHVNNNARGRCDNNNNSNSVVS